MRGLAAESGAAEHPKIGHALPLLSVTVAQCYSMGGTAFPETSSGIRICCGQRSADLLVISCSFRILSQSLPKVLGHFRSF